ncbi:non-ribosomal peptide synthetase [Rahnella bruchi]|uniref:non-ribosomal peptide synthetase n=1 Tax=Rahnella bruchi TaxID=1510573 RepID=UPI000EA1D564|nr:non-ribosomal peptide synthetase [Rahnella bruchi]
MDVTGSSLISAFRIHVKDTPDKAAVKYNGRQTTYKQLNELSENIASFISQKIPFHDNPTSILFCLERNDVTIAVILACVKLGITYIPFDPLNPDERLQYIIEDCHPAIVITTKKNAQRQNSYPEIYIEDVPPATAEILPALPETSGPGATYIMYTSGSTGKPKGVVIPQEGILRLVLNAKPFQFSSDAIIAQCGNIAFDASTLEVWGALLNGATLVVIPYETVIDSEALAIFLREEKITDAWFTVALFNQLVTENPGVFGTLNNVLTGGDALNPSMIHAVLCSDTPPGALWNGYGPTENTVFTTLHRITPEDATRGSIPIGVPITGTQCYVLDSKREPVMPGDEGELYTSGAGLATGYLNQPEKTAEAFFPNPFYSLEMQQTPQSASARMYKTGDRVKMLADGTLDFLGRVDNQVKIRGFRLEPAEVEHQLCQIAGVELAIVTVTEHLGQKKLAAWCKSTRKASEILQIFRKQVPAYMVPSYLQVVEKFPLTANGKIDKRNLPAPQYINDQATPPQTATEIWVSKVWQLLLSLPHPAGREDNFSSLGGHSLLVVKLKQKIQTDLNKSVSLTDLFNFSTLAEMAAHIDALPAQSGVIKIERQRSGEKIALSNEQVRLWLICNREPQLPHYSIPMAFQLSGELDPGRLAQALDALCQRHESLRTRIFISEGIPWQQVAEISPELILDEAKDEYTLREKLSQEVQRPFTFGNDPLLRMVLYHVPHSPWLLFINIHHIITDGWSMGIFFRELSALYAQDEALPALDCQFIDYCAWQQQLDHTADLAWWQQQLNGVSPQQLPVSVKSAVGAITRTKIIPAALHRQLNEVAIQCNTGLFNILCSALAILLSRLCNQQDITISTIWANRQHPWVAEQIGFFVNTLVLRMQVEPELPLIHWLKNNHILITEGFQHGAAPLSEVLAQSGIPSNGNQHPLCSVMLVLQNTEGGDGKGLQLAGCHTKPYPLPEEQAKCDLLFNIVPEPDGELRLETSFREGAWSEALMESLLDYYQQLMVNMTEHLQQSVARVMDIGDEMRRQQLLSWAPEKRKRHTGSVLTFFNQQVQIRPDAPAVSDFERQFSYRELDARADILARQLQNREGNLYGKRVVFALDRTSDTVALIIALLKLGAIYVPFDPEHPDDRLLYILKDCAATCLITESRYRHRQTLRPEYDMADLLVAPVVGTMPVCAVSQLADEVAYIMYTSGSTGEPKGVEVLHQGILRLVIDAAPYQVSQNAVMAQAGNIAFDASTLEIWGALLNGAHLIVIPYHTVIDSQALPATLAKYQITDAWFTVALFNQLASEDPSAFGCLEHLLIGGDALNPAIVASVLASDAPPAHIWNGYGPTENTTFTTLHPITIEDCQKDAIPIGRPIAGTVCYVLDKQHRLLPPGVPGELYASGLGLAKGYLNKPEKTDETFIPNPFWHESVKGSFATPVMYKTGDRVRWTENGTLDFLGRADNQVKIRGYRLEPGEVEHRLCELETVTQAIVNARTLHGQKQLVAWCVSESPASEILRTFRRHVPAYMVPANLQVIDSIPLTPNGKVDKKRLPPVNDAATTSQKTLPQNDTERLCAEIWQQLLKTDLPCYREDNFFNIGGHSLLVVKMTDLICRKLGKMLSVADVFNCENLAELAAHIQGESVSHNDEYQQIMQDSQLTPEGFISAGDIPLKCLLLTGATGFLGIYLLATLQQQLPDATVYCLVRGEKGGARLRQTAQTYQLTIDERRINWVHGDLEQPNIGLSEQTWQALAENIDAIYHCGAWVNHLHRYSTLRAANVISTLDLMKLCTFGRQKQFFYISTLSAAARQDCRLLEKTIADAPPMNNGYVQSKWVCEKLLSEAFSKGLNGGIYRMGNITGSTRNGISNVETNHTLNLIKGCLQQGVAPEWPGYHLDISPVDVLATLLVTSSIHHFYPDCALNLGHVSGVSWRNLLESIAKNGYPLQFVSADEWATQWVPKISSENALYLFKSFYLTPQHYSREEIDHILVTDADYSIDLPELLRVYTDFWLKSGFLAALPDMLT